MLDPESEQTREVYALFGLAMFQAQCLEKQLAMVIAVSDDSERRTAWDYDACLAENFNSTFGELVTRFKELSGGRHKELLTQLDEAAAARNGLAHRYFWDRAVQLCSGTGRRQMLEELSNLASGFSALDERLTELGDEFMRRKGIPNEAVQTHVADLLAGATQPHDPERVPNPVEITTAFEWRTTNTGGCKLILVSGAGEYLLLGERGLCFGPQNIATQELFVKPDFAKALPARTNPRPKKSKPWNYAIALANGYILRIRPGELNGKPVCRFGLRKLKHLESAIGNPE